MHVFVVACGTCVGLSLTWARKARLVCWPARKPCDTARRRQGVHLTGAVAVQVKILKGLKTGTAAEREAYELLRKELREAYPDHLPVFLEGLKRAAGKVKMPYGAPATPAAATDDGATGDSAAAADSEAARTAAAAAVASEAAAATEEAAAPEPEISQEEACQAVLAAAEEVWPMSHLHNCPACHADAVSPTCHVCNEWSMIAARTLMLSQVCD